MTSIDNTNLELDQSIVYSQYIHNVLYLINIYIHENMYCKFENLKYYSVLLNALKLNYKFKYSDSFKIVNDNIGNVVYKMLNNPELYSSNLITAHLQSSTALDSYDNRIFKSEILQDVLKLDYVPLLKIIMEHPELCKKDKSVIKNLLGYWCYLYKAKDCFRFLLSIDMVILFIPSLIPQRKQ
jgi:hypothetical protein